MSESRSAPMLGAGGSSLSFPSLSETPLGALHFQVLPLFNGEPLRAPIEELNQLVKEMVIITSRDVERPLNDSFRELAVYVFRWKIRDIQDGYMHVNRCVLETDRIEKWVVTLGIRIKLSTERVLYADMSRLAWPIYSLREHLLFSQR